MIINSLRLQMLRVVLLLQIAISVGYIPGDLFDSSIFSRYKDKCLVNSTDDSSHCEGIAAFSESRWWAKVELCQ